jgi:hypothetical protein
MAEEQTAELLSMFMAQEPPKRGVDMKDWGRMPEYISKNLKPLKTIDVQFKDGTSIHVHFEAEKHFIAFQRTIGKEIAPWLSCYRLSDDVDRYGFAKLINQTVTEQTQYVWFPDVEDVEAKHLRYVGRNAALTKPSFPVYIPTKGRYESLFTIKALEEIHVPYKAVVEAQEFDRYCEHGVKPENILVLPHRDKGLVVTRNWIWDHAQKSGVRRFWTFDDNIRSFVRLNRNMKIKVADGTILRVIEDFVDRFENVPIAGMNYDFFAKRRDKLPPYLLNTRVYSNMLIQTDIPYRNEGFYNDDTDLCLRVLKDGLCTIQFYSFLIGKAETMTVKGGMTPHYQGVGRLKMAQELVAKHPDVTTISRKFRNRRPQHNVDYSSFKKNRLKLKQEFIDNPPKGTNNYGMVLREIAKQNEPPDDKAAGASA